MKLLHVYGTMEEMGFAQGSILGQELVDFLTGVWSYLEDQAVDAFPKWVPKWLVIELANFGGDVGLDLTYLLTYKYTTHAYYIEMWHMTLGMNRTDLYPLARRVHMIGEITKGHCSMFGVKEKKKDNLQNKKKIF
jgi:isopenicillin-N N-acyltransferase like protein